jgi:hypothetical protein
MNKSNPSKTALLQVFLAFVLHFQNIDWNPRLPVLGDDYEWLPVMGKFLVKVIQKSLKGIFFTPKYDSNILFHCLRQSQHQFLIPKQDDL